MKTANRYIILSLQLTAVVCFLALAPVRAQAAAPAADLMPVVAGASADSPEGLSPGESKMASAATGAPDIRDDVADPPSLADSKKDPKKAGKETEVPDVKVPDSVKTIISNLGNATTNVTIDDLNSAREAIAKLDVLIDIEKRLADLDKIKDERTKRSVTGSASVIPASALSLPVSKSMRSVSEMGEMLPPPSEEEPRHMEIIYIEGSNGHYSALIKEGKGTRYIRAGDHLQHGVTVLAVTPEGVETMKDKVKHMEEVKDVQTVFGDSP